MQEIRQYVTELQTTLDLLPLEKIDEVIHVLHAARLNGQQVFILGNGGSASTASHFVCDLAKNTRISGVPHLRVLDILENSAVLTAYANDEGYENALANHLANFVQPGDVVIGISTSGKSPNVLRAIALGNQVNAQTIGFTGFDGGELRTSASINVHVDSCNIEQVEDVHLVLGHMITASLRKMAERSALRHNGNVASTAPSESLSPGENRTSLQ